MKKLLVLLIVCTPILVPAQSPEKQPALTTGQTHSLTVLGELWGFLKYYHPFVATGTQDWDSVLVQKAPLYLAAKDNDAIDRLTADWLTELGTPPPCPTCDNKVPDSCKFNLDLSWINKNNFSATVIDRLLFIRDNRSQDSNRFVSLDSYKQFTTKEKVYNTPAFMYPSADYRLLLLFRYWNIVNYFSPYKYLCGKDWKMVLEEKIPEFYNAPDTIAYHLAYARLIASLNEGHSNYYETPILQRFWGINYYPPFGCKLIDGQFVVDKFYNDSLAERIHIKVGDVILAVNGENAVDKYKRLHDYINASNEPTRARLFAYIFLFTSPDSNFTLRKSRKGVTYTDTFAMPPYIIPKVDSSIKPWRILDNNIGYVDMAILKPTQVDSVMNALADTKGIIFDVRNYPYNTETGIAGYLCKKPFIMGRISAPDINYPGVFRFYKQHLYGKPKSHPYAGKVVLLADESSVSHAEFVLMILQASTKTTTIGSTTAGQDGDVSKRIYLPGGLFTRFSSLGIYYPDGTSAQRAGVRIDKTVIPTIRGLQEGRDEVLEAALHFIGEH